MLTAQIPPFRHLTRLYLRTVLYMCAHVRYTQQWHIATHTEKESLLLLLHGWPASSP